MLAGKARCLSGHFHDEDDRHGCHAARHVAQLAGVVLDDLEGHGGPLVGDVGRRFRPGETGAQRCGHHPHLVDARIDHALAGELGLEIDHRQARIGRHRRGQLIEPDHVRILAHLVLHGLKDRIHPAFFCHFLLPVLCSSQLAGFHHAIDEDVLEPVLRNAQGLLGGPGEGVQDFLLHFRLDRVGARVVE
jgi:hypothetical protein